MRLVCLADLHGFLPVVPACDVLLIAGDICPIEDERPRSQARWLRTTFSEWLADVPAAHVVGVLGNHDFIGEQDATLVRELDWCYLQDESIELEGLTFYGSPWTSRYQRWAFMLDEQQLAERWARIPEAVDVLCLHSPPLGYGDGLDGRSLGSPSLLAALDARAPRLAAFGHIHSGYGRFTRGDTTLVNAAHCDMQYRPLNDPIVVDL